MPFARQYIDPVAFCYDRIYVSALLEDNFFN